jgi:fumarate hydratase class II
MAKTKYRVESDSMGKMKVPSDAYYGAQTARAVENFPISGRTLPREFIRAMGLVKLAAAQTNSELGFLKKGTARAIARAAQEVVDGKLDDHFVVDVFQTGSGTSTNMNTNEVIANRAAEILKAKTKTSVRLNNPVTISVHPNDHVNMGQSSNDVIPTAMHVSSLEAIEKDLIPSLEYLRDALSQKAKQFDHIVKIGRTHLMDATPIRLGQEFSGYASMVDHGISRLKRIRNDLSELAIGGTAVGTGINTHRSFGKKMAARISEATGVKFREAKNHFEAQASKDAVVSASGALKTVSVSLMKIANDIRWLGSGPRCGFGEILLPAIQPGSSIMPGKVNPVVGESVTQVAAQVIGNDAAITVGGQAGNFELNVMMPMMADNLLQSIRLLSRVSTVFVDKCISGIEADEERCGETIEQSLAMCTSLAPIIGYDNAAAIAKEAYASGRTVREVAREKGVLSDEELDRVLDPLSMTRPAS